MLAAREAGTVEADDIDRAIRRALTLNRALTAFYVAVSSFAIGTFSELLGGGIASLGKTEIAPAITGFGLLVATVGTVAIATGSAFLVVETWDAFGGLRGEARAIRAGRSSV